MERRKRIILDTHIWLWLVLGENKLKKLDFLKLIEDAVKNRSAFISPISIWEVSMLASKGRLSFNENIMDWVNDALEGSRVIVCPISPEIAVESCQLPGDFHGDPADRIIVASARIEKSTLLTADKEILKYAREGHLNVA